MGDSKDDRPESGESSVPSRDRDYDRDYKQGGDRLSESVPKMWRPDPWPEPPPSPSDSDKDTRED